MRFSYLILLIVSFLSYKNNLSAQPFGYNYVKAITINSTQISGGANLNDFPVLISITDPDLANISNGGKVNHVNGYDIVFTSSDCSNLLFHQIEQYNPINGNLIAWVRVPTVLFNANTIIHMYYGNSTVTINNSSTSTWINKYESVLHLYESPLNASPQMIDATANTNDGFCQGAMTATNSVTGIVWNGVLFDEIDDRIRINDFDYANTKSFSVSFWFNVNDNTGTSFQYLFSHGTLGGFNALNVYLAEATYSLIPDQNMLKTVFQDANDATNFNGLDAGNTLVDGNWHYYVFTVSDFGPPVVYIDGVQVATIIFNGGQTYNPTGNIFLGARNDNNVTRYYGGILDEFRILNDSLSPGWIQTEYNNIINPSGFYNIGPELNAVSLCSILPIELLNFEVSIIDNKLVALNWSTASETNNNYFSVERSLDALQWDEIGTVKGSGNSNNLKLYNYNDKEPVRGITYYRLKQIDFDGSYTLSEIRAANIHYSGLQIIYPNPANETLNLKLSSEFKGQLTYTIIDKLGRRIASNSLNSNLNDGNIKISLESIPEGVYTIAIQLQGDDIQFHKLIINRN